MPETLMNEETLSERLEKGDVDETWRLVLRPNWHLIHDVKRVLLVEVDQTVNEIGKFGRLDPRMSILVSLLDGNKSIGDICSEGADVFQQDPASVRETIYQALKVYPDAFELSDGQVIGRRYDPSSFIIPVNKIDMKSVRLYRPINITFHFADHCIRNCIYCNVQHRQIRREDALTTERVCELVEEAARFGVPAIGIAGGEPFIRDDIPQIARAIIENHILPGIATKAFISKDLARRLKEAGVGLVQVSIDAPIPEVADFLTGSKGFFHEAIQSIKNLKEVGITVNTNSVITPYNVRLIPQLIDLLNSLGVRHMGLAPYARSLHVSNPDSLFINNVDGRWLQDQIQCYKERNPDVDVKGFEYPLDYRYRPPSARERAYPERSLCSAGRTGFIIRENGDVVLCEEVPVLEEMIVANVKECSLEDAWNSPRVTEIIHPPREKYLGTACYDCHDYDDCHEQGRCWRESMKAYGKIYAPAPGCPRAPKGRRVY